MIEILLLWIPLCAIVGWVGTQKNRSFFGYFFLSFFLSPLIGLLVVIAVPSRNRPPAAASFYRSPDPLPPAQKKCVACAEPILLDAKKCKHCGELQPEPAPPVHAAPMNWAKIDETERSLKPPRP